MTITTENFKQKLEEELKVLTEELESIGRKNPSNPDDWEPKPPTENVVEADPNTSADKIEAYEANTAILKDLEIRYNNVQLALKKIADGKYGICETGGEQIEEKRLEANPAARTCAVHAV